MTTEFPTRDVTERLLTAADVADLLQIPKSTVMDLARRQHDPLPSVKVGRARRFMRPRLEAWIDSRATRAVR